MIDTLFNVYIFQNYHSLQDCQSPKIWQNLEIRTVTNSHISSEYF